MLPTWAVPSNQRFLHVSCLLLKANCSASYFLASGILCPINTRGWRAFSWGQFVQSGQREVVNSEWEVRYMLGGIEGKNSNSMENVDERGNYHGGKVIQHKIDEDNHEWDLMFSMQKELTTHIHQTQDHGCKEVHPQEMTETAEPKTVSRYDVKTPFHQGHSSRNSHHVWASPG